MYTVPVFFLGGIGLKVKCGDGTETLRDIYMDISDCEFNHDSKNIPT